MMLRTEVARDAHEPIEQQPRDARHKQQPEADVHRPFLPTRQSAGAADLLHAAASTRAPTLSTSLSAVIARAFAPASKSNASEFAAPAQMILVSASASQAVRPRIETEIHRP